MITSLSNDIDTVKVDMQALKSSTSLISATWETGAINRSTGEEIASDYEYRLRTSDFIEFAKNETYVIDSDYTLDVFTYTSAGVFQKADAYTNSWVSPIGVKVKLVIRKSTENTAETADIEFVKKVYTYNPSTKGVEYLPGAWANGLIDGSTGTFYHSSLAHLKTLATPYFVRFSEEKTFAITDGYAVRVFKFANDVLDGSYSEYVGKFTPPINTDLRLLIKTVESSTDAATQDFRKQVFKSIDTVIGIYNQNLTDTQKLKAFKNLGDAGLTEVLKPMANFTKNVYDPFYLRKNVRVDVSTGKDVSTTDYDVYEVTLAPHTQAVCSCLLGDATTRTFVTSVRSNVTFDANRNKIASNTASSTAYNYVNDTDYTQVVAFNIWSSTNSTYTVSDFMIEVFTDTFNLTGYKSEYIPYGMELSDIYSPYISKMLHNPRKCFEAEIADTVSKVRTLQENVNYTFAFVSDTHQNSASEDITRCTIDTFSNLKDVSEKIPLNAIYHGGDWLSVVERTQAEANAEIAEMRNWMLQSNVYGRVHCTVGNHDGVNGGAPLATTLYSSLFTHDECLVVRAGNSDSYYIDIAKPKLRIIMLSNALKVSGALGVDAETVAWFESILASTPTGANIIVMSHIGPQCADWTVGHDDIVTAINAWYDNADTGKVVAWIAGHQHYDWVVPSANSGCSFPVVVCTCSYPSSITPSSDQQTAGAIPVVNRPRYDARQDSWSVFVYRPDLGTIDMVRFGAGDDTTVDYAHWS